MDVTCLIATSHARQQKYHVNNMICQNLSYSMAKLPHVGSMFDSNQTCDMTKVPSKVYNRMKLVILNRKNHVSNSHD
jgi:hypothetical protein